MWFGLTTLVITVLAAPSAPSPPSPLPSLPGSIDHAAGVTISGISSGADFAVQFHVAFSSLVKGAGIFAGQAYHCAVTRFPADSTVPCNATPFALLGPGCAGTPGGMHQSHGAPTAFQFDPDMAVCEPSCPAGQGLLWDHCKGCTPAAAAQLKAHPKLVNVSSLLAYAHSAAKRGQIDGTANLTGHRVYLYHGTKDSCYTLGSLQDNAAFYHLLINDSSAVRLESTVASLHSIPTIDDGTPCGTEGNYTSAAPHGLEACGYDGAGECLQHLYHSMLTPPSKQQRALTRNSAANIFAFDQGEFLTVGGTWMAKTGYAFIPPQCRNNSTRCECSD